MLLNVLKEFDGSVKLPSVDGLGCFAGVLEGNCLESANMKVENRASCVVGRSVGVMLTVPP